MEKFKVGDVIKINRAGSKNWYYDGDVGTIMEIVPKRDYTSVTVNFNNHGNKRVVEDGIWYVDIRDIQPVYECKPKFKADNRSEADKELAELILG